MKKPVSTIVVKDKQPEKIRLNKKVLFDKSYWYFQREDVNSVKLIKLLSKQ